MPRLEPVDAASVIPLGADLSLALLLDMVRLTRSQVAQRLGRSVATIRRLEQEGLLVPQLGAGDVRFFHALDVDRLAERAARTGRILNRLAIHAEPSGSPRADTLARVTMRGADPNLESKCKRLAASHSALRENITDLLNELLDVLHPRSTDAINLIEEMLELLAANAIPQE